MIVGIAIAIAGAGCGKKGPPLPPLVKIPAAPGNFTAERRGSSVDLQFVVPNANTDGTRPANVDRVDVYGFTGPETITDDQLLKRGTKVATVDVKAPRDPDQTIEPDEPQEDMEPPEGKGLDQGAIAHVSEQLTPSVMTAAPRESGRDHQATDGGGERPLVGIPVPTRTYVSVALPRHGRRSPASRRVAVPLVPPPPAPADLEVTYDESKISVTWTPSIGPATAAATDGVLPSTPIGVEQPSIAYNVYDAAKMTLLTSTPVATPAYADTRIEWGAERCYAIRSVETIASLAVESEATPSKCVKLADHFPPVAPSGLVAVPSQGAVSLIWQPNTEKDLAGYLVLRARAPSEALEPVTPQPISDTTYTDTVQAGVPFVYAVEAVDKAGNRSAPSSRVEETAR